MGETEVRTWYPDEAGGRPVMILVAAGNSYETSDEAQFVQHSDYTADIAAKDREIAELNKRIDALIDQRNEASTLQFAEMRKHDVTKFERDEARECVGRLWREASAIVKDGDDIGYFSDGLVERLESALAATPEHLRK